MYYSITNAEHNIRIINLSEDGQNICAKMYLNYMNNVINLSYVECNCISMKGRCFEIFMNILYQTATSGELFQHKIHDMNTSVELFVSPANADNDAINKLKRLYSRFGFMEDASIDNFMQSTLAKIGVKNSLGGSRKRSRSRSYALRRRSSRRCIS